MVDLELAMYVGWPQTCASASLVLGLKVCAAHLPPPPAEMSLRELLYYLKHFCIMMGFI